ncbi:zinc-binding dehydrogenase [Candidatus Bathyarchaeota archaeon]|nr:MAG: zinc-binding dehydrogenase [Candidatus Bathyarchaeota archaeon]
MLACLLNESNKIELRQVPTPQLDKGDTLVKMEACGICGTDLEKIDGRLGPGGILGHEVSGTIQQAPTLCPQFKKTNIDPCGIAESFRVPRYNIERGALIHLPNEQSLEEGAMIEPTACCIRAIRRAKLQENDNVLIVGLGPTGLTQVQILRLWTSGKIIGTDIIESRLRMGSRLGADETLDPQAENVPEIVKKMTGAGADLALVSTGNEKALDQAFGSVRKGGKVLLFGAPGVGAQHRLDVSTLFSGQISLISSYSCVEPEMHEAIRLVSDKRIDVGSLISDRYKLEEAEEGLEYAKTSRTAIKTIITA